MYLGALIGLITFWRLPAHRSQFLSAALRCRAEHFNVIAGERFFSAVMSTTAGSFIWALQF
jgi:hypothetical protein